MNDNKKVSTVVFVSFMIVALVVFALIKCH